MSTIVKGILVVAFLGGLGLGYLTHYLVSRPTQVVVSLNQTPAKVVAPTPIPAPVPTTQNVKAQVPACEDRTYTVKSGDSLWLIAKNNYGGRAYLYPYLAEVNKIVTRKLVIHPDQKLTIPCKVELCCLAPLVQTKVAEKKSAVKSVAVRERKAPVQVAKSAPVQTAKTEAPAPVAEPAAVAPAPAVVVPPAPAPVPAPQTPAPVVNVQQNTNVVVPPAQALVIPTPVFKDSGQPTWQGVKKESGKGLSAPGALWDTLVSTPLEPDNWSNYFNVSQGIIFGELPGGVKFKPYYAFNMVSDTKGYIYNNRQKHEGGLSLDKPFSHGIASVKFAYATEARKGKVGPRETESGFTLYTDGWVGHDQPSDSSGSSMFPKTFPGSGWWVFGKNLSPFEKDNISLQAKGEQGFTLVKVKRFSLVPEVWTQVSRDTQGYFYNNRIGWGTGVKAPITFGTGVFDVVVGWEWWKEYGKNANSSRSVNGPKVSIDLWNGWRGKLGGK